MLQYRVRVICIAILLFLAVGVSNALAKNNPPSETPITITVGEISMTAVLNDSDAAKSFIRSLPQTLSMNRLFDREYYTTLPEALASGGSSLQQTYEVGDVAYWPSQRYFGLLFDHTRPLSSPIIVLGKITSDVRVLDVLGETATMTITVAKDTQK